MNPLHPLTPAEYAAAMANRDRPLTDDGIGRYTEQKRTTDAQLSALHTTVDTERTELAERVVELRRRRTTGCGTVDGYQAHRSRGEWPCQRCRDARRKERDG